MLNSFVILFLFLEFSASARADNYFYLMGGGDIEKTADTIFDSDVTDLGKFIGKSDWHTTISYDGGHPASKSMIYRSFPNARNFGNFNKSDFSKIISDIKTKLESGVIESGDQLMIDIETHGKKKDDSTKEISHSVGTIDGDVSLDALREVVDLATQKGVKLAILDMSCYSGQTLNIANSKICMISAAGPSQFGITDSVNDSMYLAFKKGLNLEGIFSKARAIGKKIDFPMINTPAGIKIQNELYDLVRPYLDYDDKDSSEFSANYPVTEGYHNLRSGIADGEADAIQQFNSQQCFADTNFSNLMSFLRQFENTIGASSAVDPTAALKLALKKYRDFQLHYEGIASGAIAAGQEVKDLIAKLYPDQKDLFKEEDGLAILGANYDGSLKILRDLLNKANPETDKNYDWDRTYYPKEIEKVENKKRIVEDIKKQMSPASQSAMNRYSNAFLETQKVTEPLAQAVSIELKKVYLLLYKSSSSNEGNACSNFVL